MKRKVFLAQFGAITENLSVPDPSPSVVSAGIYYGGTIAPMEKAVVVPLLEAVDERWSIGSMSPAHVPVFAVVEDSWAQLYCWISNAMD